MDPGSTHGLWADLSQTDFTPADSDFTVLGVPYDGAACARKGAALGPERIRFWSTHLTPFSEDRTRLGDIRISDQGDIPVSDQVQDFERVRGIQQSAEQWSGLEEVFGIVDHQQHGTFEADPIIPGRSIAKRHGTRDCGRNDAGIRDSSQRNEPYASRELIDQP